MANTLKFYISEENQRLLASPGAFNQASAPFFFSGNEVSIELHLMQGAGIARSPYEVPFPAGSSVQMAVGSVAERPTAGTWKLSVSSTQTTDLDFDATAGEVQTALNAIGAVSSAGGVSVASLGDGYSITWNTVGTKPLIVPGTDALVPSSYESIFILQAGSATDQEIIFVELRQSPVALATNFTPIGTPVVSAATVSAWNGTNKVVRVGIEPEPMGGFFTLSFDGDVAVIPANSGLSDIRSALNSAGITDYSGVTQTGSNQYDIVFTIDEAVAVNGSGLIAPIGIQGSLNLATSEIIAYLGSDATRAAVLEIVVTAAGNDTTVCQVPCFVANGVITSGAVSPVAAGTILTETVANARYIRRDAAQSPSGADLDIIWPNLGVTSDGSDVAAAISGANSPASGNVFATMADVGVNPFDQDLNTTDTVSFDYVNVSNGFGIDGGDVLFKDSLILSDGVVSTQLDTTQGLSLGFGGINFPDLTQQTTAFVPADYLAKAGNLSGLASNSTARTNLGLGTMAVETASNYLTTASASSTYLSISTASSTYAPLTDFDQGVKTTDSVTFAGVIVTDGLTAGVDIDELGITFPDATVQESAPVFSSGTGQSGGSGSTIHHNDYPDEITIVIGGVTYAMPARVI